MPFTSFDEVEQYVLANGIRKTIALCGAHDEPALSAVVAAKRKGLVKAILIGETQGILDILASLDEPADDYVIVDEPEETEAARKAIALVRSGTADIPMKGLMQTASYMRAILNKETGILPPGHVLSETTVFEWPAQGRMMFVSDCGINIVPDVAAKVQIVHNAAA